MLIKTQNPSLEFANVHGYRIYTEIVRITRLPPIPDYTLRRRKSVFLGERSHGSCRRLDAD